VPVRRPPKQRKALADAVHVEELLATNPAERSKRPRDRGHEPIRVWTTGQLDAFLTAAQSHRLYAFYRLAAYTGARRGELLYLRWQAVNLDAGEITFAGINRRGPRPANRGNNQRRPVPSHQHRRRDCHCLA
jgi:integrase